MKHLNTLFYTSSFAIALSIALYRFSTISKSMLITSVDSYNAMPTINAYHNHPNYQCEKLLLEAEKEVELTAFQDAINSSKANEIDLNNSQNIQEISSRKVFAFCILLNLASSFAINKSFNQLVSASNPNTFLAGTALAISGALYIYSAVQAIRLSNMREFIVKTNDDKSFYSGYKSPYHLATAVDTTNKMTEDNTVYYNKMDGKMYYKSPNKAAIEVIAKKINNLIVKLSDKNEKSVKNIVTISGGKHVKTVEDTVAFQKIFRN